MDYIYTRIKTLVFVPLSVCMKQKRESCLSWSESRNIFSGNYLHNVAQVYSKHQHSFSVTAARNRTLGWCVCVKKWYFVNANTETQLAPHESQCGRVYKSWISLPGSQMPADDLQPIRVTFSSPPRKLRSNTHTYDISQLKCFHASSQFTMNQNHITSRDDSFIKSLWISDRCLSYSPGLEHLTLECLNWLNCIDLTPPSCEWWIAVFSFSETKPVFKGSSNKLRSAFGGFVAEKRT